MTDVAEIWVWTVELLPGGPDTMPDITGYEVSARDGSIGKVDEVVDGKDGRSYIVVDTGFWIFGEKRMLPASVVERLDTEAKKVFVNLRKDEIRDAPDWDEVRSKQEEYRREVADHYTGTRTGSRPSSG